MKYQIKARTRLLFCVFVFCFSAQTVFADEVQPGEVCTAAQEGYYRNSSKTTVSEGGNMMFCDGVTWQRLIVYDAEGNLILGGTGAITLPVGAEVDRPSTGAAGMIRFSSDSTAFEGYDGSSWSALGGDGIGTVTGQPEPEWNFALSDLSNVILASETSGEALVYNGSAWVNSDIADTIISTVTGQPSPDFSFALSDLSNVTLASETSGEALVYNGSAWVNSDIADTVISTVTGQPSPDFSLVLGDLSNVTVSSEASGDALVYNGSAWVNTATNQGLWTQGTDEAIYYDGTTPLVGVGMTDPDVELDVDGDIEYTGTITDMSDRRLKEDIKSLPGGQLEKIALLQGVSFKMKDDPEGETEFGFIAQDVRPYLPEMVHERDNGMLSLNYVGMIAPMVEAIKELKAENESLRARVDKLEAKE